MQYVARSLSSNLDMRLVVKRVAKTMEWALLNDESLPVEPSVAVLRMTHQFMTNYNYLITDPISRKSVVVDPAWQLDKLELAIANSQSQLSGVLLTHSHHDHIHLAKSVALRYQCPIWMSPQEIHYSGFAADQLVAIGHQPWQIGSMTIEPLLTPGHTPGCVCYRIADNLFTGDVLFAEGCGMCPDLAGAGHMFDSLKRLKQVLRPTTRIYPGHSYGKVPGQFFASVLKENIYLQFDDRDTFVAFRMRARQQKSKMLDFK